MPYLSILSAPAKKRCEKKKRRRNGTFLLPRPKRCQASRGIAGSANNCSTYVATTCACQPRRIAQNRTGQLWLSVGTRFWLSAPQFGLGTSSSPLLTKLCPEKRVTALESSGEACTWNELLQNTGGNHFRLYRHVVRTTHSYPYVLRSPA